MNPREKKKGEMMAVMGTILQEQEDMRKRHDQEVQDMTEKIRTGFFNLVREEFPHVLFLLGEEKGIPTYRVDDHFSFATEKWISEMLDEITERYVKVERKSRHTSNWGGPFSMDVALQSTQGDVDGDYEW